MRKLFVILWGFFTLTSTGQEHLFGIQTQVVVTIGSPVNRVGINLNGFWLTSYSQINIGTQSSFYFSGMGPKGSYIENRAHFSLIGLVGKKRNPQNHFFNPLFHQSDRFIAFGYSYLIYWDNRQTSQRSGMFSLQFDRVALQFENDLFGGQGRDRFRTANLHAFYLDSLNMLGTHVRLWTGETRGGLRTTDEEYPSKYGYKNLENTLYGKTSHGIATMSYQRLLPFAQQVGIELGIDAERIRHFYQNRLVHDFQFSKKNTRKHNPHYPMLKDDGTPYLFKSGTSVRKAKFVGLMTLGGQ